MATEKIEKNIEKTSPPTVKKSRRTAFSDRNWEVVLVIAFVFLISIGLTGAMVLISVGENVYRILPAAGLLVMVGLWLTLTLPFYSKLSFWGTIIFIATYLMFGIPFVFLGLLPLAWAIAAIIFIIFGTASFLIMFRQRRLFLPPPPAPVKRKTTNE